MWLVGHRDSADTEHMYQDRNFSWMVLLQNDHLSLGRGTDGQTKEVAVTTVLSPARQHLSASDVLFLEPS